MIDFQYGLTEPQYRLNYLADLPTKKVADMLGLREDTNAD